MLLHPPAGVDSFPYRWQSVQLRSAGEEQTKDRVLCQGLHSAGSVSLLVNYNLEIPKLENP